MCEVLLIEPFQIIRFVDDVCKLTYPSSAGRGSRLNDSDIYGIDNAFQCPFHQAVKHLYLSDQHLVQYLRSDLDTAPAAPNKSNQLLRSTIP